MPDILDPKNLLGQVIGISISSGYDGAFLHSQHSRG